TALLVAADDSKRYCLYSPDTMERVVNLWGLEQDLDDAVQSGELELFYQPKISVATGCPCGAEALMRWSSPTRGFVPPDVFIPIADSTGRIETLTWFALNAASRQTMQWSERWGPLSVAVNVTPNIVEHSDLIRLAHNATGLWDLPPERLVIELTEGALMRKPEQSLHILNEIRAAGIKVAIDDFGTGYSSLAYFKNIPADELKIDKSFVLNMLNDEADERIVRAVISLAHSFGLKVTAEGVEDKQTADALAELGCDYLQGYYYSRPTSQPEFSAWLDNFSQPE
ncbi:MAG: EAL domain-containing protein, partial [Gammaproteobacteria bacterium]|nr:EAL domain-containing protein [Gammaproteobacteria bacterium]